MFHIGVFDHLDRGQVELDKFYEDRFRVIEAFERSGFYAYHVAEHHFTPLGMAPSPSVYLAAVAQRTKRIRFGPLVYALPLYHPLRLIQEICMLDQISGGRLEIGFGRGASSIEAGYYDQRAAQEIYEEGLQLVLEGLKSRKLSFEGKIYRFKDIPLALEPLQKPHLPLWYGVHSVESAARAARQRLNRRLAAQGLLGLGKKRDQIIIIARLDTIAGRLAKASDPPSVILTWPLPCAKLDQPTNLAAVASAGMRGVKSVEFFVNGSIPGSSATAT
jgi:alkanesulfonate monooxygenase SsuD/methylene tetrahydromethanopterin reductase-like flavin-dependent oxidoreductase (luciferase family)